MIATRGLGRSGTQSSYIVSYGMGSYVLIDLVRDKPLARVPTIDRDLVIEIQPIVTDFVVVGVPLTLGIDVARLTLITQEGALQMKVMPIRTSVDTTDDLTGRIEVHEPTFVLVSQEEDLSLVSQAPDLTITSITDDLEVLDEDQPLLMAHDELELLLSTTPLKGRE